MRLEFAYLDVGAKQMLRCQDKANSNGRVGDCKSPSGTFGRTRLSANMTELPVQSALWPHYPLHAASTVYDILYRFYLVIFTVIHAVIEIYFNVT